jgi:hemolysin activation/secretion protein
MSISRHFAFSMLACAAVTAHAQVELQPAQDDACQPCARPMTQLAQAAPAAPPQSVPVAPATASAAFRLNGVRLSGVQSLDAAELDALAAPYIGHEVTLAELEGLAQQIGVKYRERGYFLAQALVPVQVVQDGVVEISVIEGRLGKITIELAPDAPISEERVRAFLAPLQVGQALNGPQYERAMLLLSDQPGLRVSSHLEESAQPGATDLIVEVAATPRWTFSADADNQGTQETGRYRIGGSVRWASPLGIGDNLDVRLMASDDGGLAFGRLAYEAPLNASGLRAGLGISHVYYDLGGQFADLKAHGTADVVDFSLSYALLRTRRQNLIIRLGADYKDLEDNYDAVDYSLKKRVTGLNLGWAWELRDTLLGGGYWASSGAWYHGRLAINDRISHEADQSDGGLHTAGNFDKLGLQFSRLQHLFDRHSLYLSLGGQWASKNLDASEKLALGGARAVRAYASSEALADQALIGTIEWRWSVGNEWTPFAFYDAAHGWSSKNPLPGTTDNHENLRGAGIGVRWGRAGDFSINSTLAWRTASRPAIADGGGHNPRLFVQLQKVF